MSKYSHSQRKRRTRKENTQHGYFEGICRGLKDVIALLESGQKLTFDKIKPLEKPNEMGSTDIMALRKRLHVSQRVLAGLLNVSIKTVQAWERNTNPNRPGGSSLRLLQIMQECPEVPATIMRKAYTPR